MICPHWILWTPTARCRLAHDGRARCNTDHCPADLGPWGAWRSFVAPYCQSWALLCDAPDRLAADLAYVFLVFYASEEFGWSP